MEEESKQEGESGQLVHPEMEVDFQIDLDPENPVARFSVPGQDFILREGEWSDWMLGMDCLTRPQP